VVREEVTPERIDELLHFLPRFAVPGRAYVDAWKGGEKTEDGAITMPYPVYKPDVREFFRLAGQAWWLDRNYRLSPAVAMLKEDDAIRHATLKQVRTMLTYCVRGERFCDGHWEGLLESGRIVALLRRLDVLRTQIEGVPRGRRTRT